MSRGRFRANCTSWWSECLSLSSRVKMLYRLAEVLEKLINMERRAYGIKAGEPVDTEDKVVLSETAHASRAAQIPCGSHSSDRRPNRPARSPKPLPLVLASLVSGKANATAHDGSFSSAQAPRKLGAEQAARTGLRTSVATGCGAEFKVVVREATKGGRGDDVSCRTVRRTRRTARSWGWRQLGWPVDDNYLGRFCTGAGPVREAGFIVSRSSFNEGSRCARQEDHGPPSAKVQATPPEAQSSRRSRQGRHQ